MAPSEIVSNFGFDGIPAVPAGAFEPFTPTIIRALSRYYLLELQGLANSCLLVAGR